MKLLHYGVVWICSTPARGMERMKGKRGQRLWERRLGLLRGRLVGFEGMMKRRRGWTNGRGIVSFNGHRFSWRRMPITEAVHIEYTVACHRYLSTNHSNQPLNIQVFVYSAPNLLSTSHFYMLGSREAERTLRVRPRSAEKQPIPKSRYTVHEACCFPKVSCVLIALHFGEAILMYWSE